MMLPLPHPAAAQATASSALFWLIGGGMVLLSYQLRRMRRERKQAGKPVRRERPVRATEVAAAAAEPLRAERVPIAL